VSRLLALYPAAWRARYGDEFAELLEARPPSPRDRLDIVIGAIDARINPQVPDADGGERSVAGDRAARAVAIVVGVLFTIWGVVGATSMVPWDSGLEPTISAELMNLAWASGALGSLLAPVAFGIVIARYERVLGGAGLAGATLASLGLIMSAFGMGIAALLALCGGVVLFSWRARERILSTPIAVAFATGSLLCSGAFLAFVAGDGKDVGLLLPMVALGPSWILFGLDLRRPQPMLEGSSPTASLAGA
jgi:MFS family permease